MKKPTVASFFAGIGGFDLGYEQAGFEVNFQCEVNSFCKSVLKHHWPNILYEQDIASLDPISIPEADVWCGGFPCQDLSVARGSSGRHGLNGSRSGLFFKLTDLAKIKMPRAILIENVHGLLNSNNGKDFAELLYTLSELGYAIAWRLLNSRYFGVPQSRPRVYICAWKNNHISAGNVLFENVKPVNFKNEREAFLSTSWKHGKGPIPPKLAFCLAATSGRHTGTDWSRTYIPYENDVRRLTPLECERLQGFPDHWTKIDSEFIDLEKSDSLRYHALGNAVTVSVVRWIADRIRNQLNNTKNFSVQLKSSDGFLIDSLERWPGLRGSKMISGKLSSIRQSESKTIWPNAGVIWNDIYIANNTAPSLSIQLQSDLINIIEFNRPDSRYFLSPNAAEGILRRVDSQNRHLFPPLRIALGRLSGKNLCITKNIEKPIQRDIHYMDSECV